VEAQTKYLLILLGLGLIDVFIPVPIIGLILIYVLLQRPAWFRQTVRDVYGEE
jgi:hypothetical protein